MTYRPKTLGLLVAVLVLAAPLAIEAQQTGKVYRIGVLEVVGEAANTEYFGAFRDGLAELWSRGPRQQGRRPTS